MDRLYTEDAYTSTMSTLVNLVGRESADKITANFGGEAIYIPRKAKDGRDEQIKHEFRDLLSGGGTCMSSYRQLAKKYDLTPRRIMAIVNH
jgi:Mor family transcriptional regulator